MARTRVLISDLDGTLVGDDAALERFADWRVGTGRAWRLVYATGRSEGSVRELVATSPLPEPDGLITGVGTRLSAPWSEPWSDWPPPPPDRWRVDTVREVLADEPGVILQPDDDQSDIKASYRTGELGHQDLLRIGRALRTQGVSGRLIHSAGRYLDVVPRPMGKRAAARHLLARWRTRVEDAVTAGDSGNDRDLLRLGGYAIVVGNASDELRGLRGPRIIRTRHTYADGVLEGLRLVAAMTDRARLDGDGVAPRTSLSGRAER